LKLRSIADALPFGRRFRAPLSPDAPLVVVGDIHGNCDALERLLQRLDEEKLSDHQLIFVGDMIDRGDHSKAVVQRVEALCRSRGAIGLMGNHEAMMLAFLANPRGRAERWLKFGGLQTLASFGVSVPSMAMTVDQRDIIANALKTALGPTLLDWIKSRPAMWQSGNVVAVHAALDPRRAPDDQQTECCLWGHKDFRRISRKDGVWVVHGHTVVDEPRHARGVISIDTGAYATDRLTAAVIEPAALRFITV